MDAKQYSEIYGLLSAIKQGYEKVGNLKSAGAALQGSYSYRVTQDASTALHTLAMELEDDCRLNCDAIVVLLEQAYLTEPKKDGA